MASALFPPGLLPRPCPSAEATDPISAKAGAAWNVAGTRLLRALSLLTFAGLYD